MLQSSPKGSQESGLDVGDAHAPQVDAFKKKAASKISASKPKKRKYDHKDEVFEGEQALSGAEYLTPAHIYEASCHDFRTVIDEITAVNRIKGPSKS